MKKKVHYLYKVTAWQLSQRNIVTQGKLHGTGGKAERREYQHSLQLRQGVDKDMNYGKRRKKEIMTFKNESSPVNNHCRGDWKGKEECRKAWDWMTSVSRRFRNEFLLCFMFYQMKYCLLSFVQLFSILAEGWWWIIIPFKYKNQVDIFVKL